MKSPIGTVLLTFLVAVSAEAWAPDAGVIEGVVRDESGGVLPGVTVSLAAAEGGEATPLTGGAAAALEPVLLRAKANERDLLCWKPGETAASTAELLELNRLSAADIVRRARDLSERQGSAGRQNPPRAKVVL